MRFIPVLLTLLLVAMMVAPTMRAADPLVKVDLLSTDHFAILSGETITNTGPTTIDGESPEGGGDIGMYPGSAITAPADITMTGWAVLINEGSAIQAKTDLVHVYDDAARRTPATPLAGDDNQLGGQTLKSGVYSFGHATTANLIGTLTLDAENNDESVFIFQASSDLITASGSKIVFINGGKYCRVFWQVTSSVTLGTYSQFVGHIFAYTSIAAQHGATVQGQLLARTGAVTLDTNTIINGLCAANTPPLTPIATVSSGSSSGGGGSSSGGGGSSSGGGGSSSGGSGSSGGGSGSIPPTGDNSMDMAIFLFALVTISTVTVFVVRKKITNK